MSGIAILILIVLRNIADIGQAMNEPPLEKHTNKPDWSIFANVPKVPLWTAVCLSMDLDPNLDKPQEYFGHDWCDLQKIEYYRRTNPEYLHRLGLASMVAADCACDFVLLHRESTDVFLWPVLLSRFWIWAAAVGWELPEEVHNIA